MTSSVDRLTSRWHPAAQAITTYPEQVAHSMTKRARSLMQINPANDAAKAVGEDRCAGSDDLLMPGAH